MKSINQDGKVTCAGCKNDVVPKLWHDDMNSLFFNRSNQHICPICGVTMYRTGGGISDIGYFSGTVLFVFFLSGFLNEVGVLTNDTVLWFGLFLLVFLVSQLCKKLYGASLVSLVTSLWKR